jgi:adenine-specific DNA-methyltransferase
MTDNQKKLMNILHEMFQFGQSDLDFGIYRIMRMKRDEINRFIEEELPVQISTGLSELAGLDTAAEVAAIDKQIADTKATPLSDAIKTAAVAELEEKKKSLAASVDIIAMEADVYNHLTNFFSRYYDDGDFISQRRYKGGVYAIPYEGEEVKLHWANADQYYVKTSEYFKDYTFKTMYGDTVHFKLIEAETEMDNNKAKEKRFFQLHTDNPFEVIDGELFVYVEYKASEYSAKTAQAKHISEIVAAFASVQTQPEYIPFAAIMTVTDNKTLLERQLKRYTARNTFDYFIHKDLGKFLCRELDFYIKNEVIFLDDIDEQDETKTKEYLTKAKVIRKIARKIITFLAQIEDFQKKLYLKKKFVVETNYCITLDRVPEAMYPEIAANDAQREEWVRLFAIDEIEAADGDLVNTATTIAYSVPLTVEFLKQNPFLVLDTAFFSTEFKELLIASIDDLDEKLDGLLIHSENSQALRILHEKYNQKVKSIYIDPPYNAKSSEILYKNNYKHSSWISLLENRVTLARKLLSNDGISVTAIDEIENNKLGLLLDNIFYDYDGKACVSVVINPSGQQGKNFSTTNEFLYFYYHDMPQMLKKESRSDEDADVRNFMNGSKGESGDYLRTTGKNCFYPIYVSNGEVIGFGDVCNDDFHPGSANIIKTDGTIEIYPVDSDGVERKWLFERATVEDIFEELSVQKNKKTQLFEIIRTKKEINYKTVWTNPLYSAKTYGTMLLNDMFGKKVFTFPKSLYAVKECVYMTTQYDSIVLDYFAGSGTTGHAVLHLNREDNGKRKYILVEMGEYFDTVTKPRIQKVIYSMDTNLKGWKNGKPISRKGSSHAFKYLRLESYEDTLNNIVLSGGNYDFLGAAREGYMLSYMLSTEAVGSASLLNVEKLDKPFSYKMNITRNLKSAERNIDLVETFNYLIGLTVVRSHALVSYDADFVSGEYGAVTATLKSGDAFKFKAIEGTAPNDDKTLVIWREMTGDIEKDNAALDAYFLSLPNARSFKRIYVNCDNNLLNLRSNGESWQVVLIDEEMKKRMFENVE